MQCHFPWRQTGRCLSVGVRDGYLWPKWFNRQTERVMETPFTRLGDNAESLRSDGKRQCYGRLVSQVCAECGDRCHLTWRSSAGPISYQPWVSGRLLTRGAAVTRCQVIYESPRDSLTCSGWCAVVLFDVRCPTSHFSHFYLWQFWMMLISH